MAAWIYPTCRPDGTGHPRNSAGRVYCGYSSNPWLNDSSTLLASSPKAREGAGHGIHDHQRRQVAVGEDVVADAEFVIREVLSHPFVVSLIAAADQDQSGQSGQFPGNSLGKRATGRPREDDPQVGTAFRPEGFDGFKERFRLQDHSGSAAVGSVVHRPVTVMRPLPLNCESSDRGIPASGPFG